MPLTAFQQKVLAYNASKAGTVAVNPPEAEQVLAGPTAQEVANVAPPVAAPVASALGELTRGQKAAATRAANKAKPPETGVPQPSAPADEVPSQARGVMCLDDFTSEELVAELRKRGLGVTAVKQY